MLINPPIFANSITGASFRYQSYQRFYHILLLFGKYESNLIFTWIIIWTLPRLQWPQLLLLVRPLIQIFMLSPAHDATSVYISVTSLFWSIHAYHYWFDETIYGFQSEGESRGKMIWWLYHLLDVYFILKNLQEFIDSIIKNLSF